MRHGDLDGLHVEFLGKVDGAADRLAGLARKPEDEVAVNRESQLLAVLHELACALERCALLDVLQDLRVARLKADDQQPAARVLHRLQGLKVGGHPRSAGPGQSQRLELGAKFDGARLLDVEGVVVEEELLYLRPVVLLPSPARPQYRRPSACARRVRSGSAATGRRCTAPGIRASSTAQR